MIDISDSPHRCIHDNVCWMVETGDCCIKESNRCENYCAKNTTISPTYYSTGDKFLCHNDIHDDLIKRAKDDERKRVLKELLNETKIHDLRIENGVFILATEGVIGHQLIRLITDFYETNGNAPNYFTFEVSGVVRDKSRRFEITIRELMNGTKSPADTIKELKKGITSLQERLENV